MVFVLSSLRAFGWGICQKNCVLLLPSFDEREVSVFSLGVWGKSIIVSRPEHFPRSCLHQPVQYLCDHKPTSLRWLRTMLWWSDTMNMKLSLPGSTRTPESEMAHISVQAVRRGYSWIHMEVFRLAVFGVSFMSLEASTIHSTTFFSILIDARIPS